MKKATLVFAFWVCATLMAFSQGARPGWTEYRINGGEVVLSLPNSMKLFHSKEKGFSSVKNADGSYSVNSREEVLFVPLTDQTDYDKEEDMNLNNMVVVMIDDDKDGLGKAIELMQKYPTARSVVGWGLKIAVGLERHSNDEVKMTAKKNVTLKKVGDKDAVFMGISLEDKTGKMADGDAYLIENRGKGIIVAFLKEQGKTGFTKKDIDEVLSTIRFK